LQGHLGHQRLYHLPAMVSISGEMKVAVVARLLAEWDMDVKPRHEPVKVSNVFGAQLFAS